MASGPSDIQSLFGIDGLVTVVTGGGSGIGLMIAQALEANGATVYIIGRRKESLEKAAATAKHGKIHPVVGDVTSKTSLAAAAATIGNATGGYADLVVANSGIGGPMLGGLPPDADLATFQGYLAAWDTGAFTETFATNVTGVFNTIVAFLPLLDAANKREGRPKQRSQVVATGSIGGYNRVPLAGYAYGSSKAAVHHMMKQFATSLVPYGIRSNVIAPGFYPSEMTEEIISKGDAGGWPKSMVPEQRPGDADDIAGAVLFLASKAGAYINGNVLVTDGGRLGVVPSSY
ncbi:putative short chain dehydrogenase reductase [Rosellinia necatrix]|uniref:Putative short chain dehydrogenase reductase n=1 Tax=Rosellinia necatrix TaxID=77044 RepID=A0A1S7UMN8_ROSNE|nr:putative short chain dehydrogenase reductase [Rosellinia necatrix]